jgi:hypothetical protein
MEAFSSLSLVGRIAQVIDFSSRLVAGTNEIYSSAEGALENHLRLDTTTNNFLRLCTELSSAAQSTPTNLTASENALCILADWCLDDAKLLLHILDDLKVKGGKSKWMSFRQALRGALKEDKVQNLEKRLSNYRSQLSMQLIALLRLDTRKSRLL